MNAADYWRERDLQNAIKIYEYSDRQGQMVTQWFSRAARDMDAAIRDFIRKYASNNQITYQQAKMQLSDSAMLKELTEHYEKLLAVAPSDPMVNDWLTKLHTMRNINREQYLQAQLDMIASEVFGKYADATAQTLTTMFEESYYKSMFDQQQYVGFGSSFNRLSTNFIAAATSTKWSGKNYSQAIWGDHRVSLARYMNRIITTGVIDGKSNQMMTAELQKALATSAYNARRLIRTDASYVANRGSLLGYQQFGTEDYKYLSTLDYKTSEICRDMDGKVFKVADAKPGVNMPPLHPFCRSTTVPNVPDAEFDSDNTRTARDGKGNTYKVPASMTYRQWYAQHVQPYKEELVAEQKYKHGRADAEQWKRYRDVLNKDAPKSLEVFQNIKYTDVDNYGNLKRQYRHTNYYETHLTHEEKAAVLSYVSGAYTLNAKLREGLALDDTEQAYVRQLDSSLDKLPIFEGEVVRSLVLDSKEMYDLAQKALTGELVFSAYTSTSTLNDYHDQPNAIMHIVSKTGRDLRYVNKQEQEVLFRRNTKFTILSVILEEGVLLIEAEELL